MTTSASDRAKALVDQIYDELEYVRVEEANWMQSIIAAAITQAENEKLEEAARCAQAIMAKADPGGCSWCAADEINTAILSLVEKD